MAKHRGLVAAMNVEQYFQLDMRACSSLTTFDGSWVLPCLRGISHKIRELCGGIASFLPNTAPVESEFPCSSSARGVYLIAY